MSIEEHDDKFSYSYSAKQQEEIEQIRKKYIPQTEDKMERLRRLDRSVTTPGRIFSWLFGIFCTLIFGGGMCMCMVWGEKLFVYGVAVGIVGILGMLLNYPLYHAITNRRRQQLAPEILRLTDELMKN